MVKATGETQRALEGNNETAEESQVLFRGEGQQSQEAKRVPHPVRLHPHAFGAPSPQMSFLSSPWPVQIPQRVSGGDIAAAPGAAPSPSGTIRMLMGTLAVSAGHKHCDHDDAGARVRLP